MPLLQKDERDFCRESRPGGRSYRGVGFRSILVQVRLIEKQKSKAGGQRIPIALTIHSFDPTLQLYFIQCSSVPIKRILNTFNSRNG